MTHPTIVVYNSVPLLRMFTMFLSTLIIPIRLQLLRPKNQGRWAPIFLLFLSLPYPSPFGSQDCAISCLPQLKHQKNHSKKFIRIIFIPSYYINGQKHSVNPIVQLSVYLLSLNIFSTLPMLSFLLCNGFLFPLISSSVNYFISFVLVLTLYFMIFFIHSKYYLFFRLNWSRNHLLTPQTTFFTSAERTRKWNRQACQFM